MPKILPNKVLTINKMSEKYDPRNFHLSSLLSKVTLSARSVAIDDEHRQTPPRLDPIDRTHREPPKKVVTHVCGRRTPPPPPISDFSRFSKSSPGRAERPRRFGRRNQKAAARPRALRGLGAGARATANGDSARERRCKPRRSAQARQRRRSDDQAGNAKKKIPSRSSATAMHSQGENTTRGLL